MGNLLVVVRIAALSCTVSGGTAGVVEGQPVLGAALPQLPGVVQVEHLEDGRVFFGSIGSCPEVKDGIYLSAVGVQPGEECVSVHPLSDPLADQVALLIRSAEVVHSYHIGVAGIVEPAYPTRADKARCSRNNNHDECI
jgi:hypothetical protein